MNELSLCAGNGGMSLGLRLAVPEARTICMVEREGFACADLARKMQAGRLDQAAVFSDVATFDGKPWRGVVDIVTAGFPCQPFSTAGGHRGVEDERWLWPSIERIIGECEPRFVFLENVPGVVQHGLGPVLRGLAGFGFDAEWSLFSASSVGAPHIRKRFFLLAAHSDCEPVREEFGVTESRGERGASGDELDGLREVRELADASAVADSASDDRGSGECGEEAGTRSNGERGRRSAIGGTVVGDTSSSRSSFGECGAGHAREELSTFERTVWPPGPSSDWSGIPEELWPAVGDSNGGRRWEEGDSGEQDERIDRPGAGSGGQSSSEPGFCGVDHGTPNRVDRLRSLGNGLVPLVVAYAFRALRARGGW